MHKDFIIYIMVLMMNQLGGAAWLYYAIGEEKYNEKYNAIADAEYSPYDPYRYTDCEGLISWDDKRPEAYVLIAKLTKL